MNRILKLSFTVIIAVLLTSCEGESTSKKEQSNDSQIVVKEGAFYAIVEDVIFNEHIITDMSVSNLDCDTSLTGLICKDLQNRVKEEGLFFSSDQSKIILEETYEILKLTGRISYGEKNFPAQWNYSIDEETQSFVGELIFQLEDKEIVIYIKGII